MHYTLPFEWFEALRALQILEKVFQLRPTKILDRSFKKFGTLIAPLLNVGTA